MHRAPLSRRGENAEAPTLTSYLRLVRFLFNTPHTSFSKWDQCLLFVPEKGEMFKHFFFLKRRKLPLLLLSISNNSRTAIYTTDIPKISVLLQIILYFLYHILYYIILYIFYWFDNNLTISFKCRFDPQLPRGLPRGRKVRHSLAAQ